MEPLKLNIEITLSEESINKLVAAMGAAIGGSFAAVLAKLAESGSNEAPKAEAVEEPAAPVEAAPVAQEKPADDIPEDLPITDEEMAEATRAAVTRLKAAGKSTLFIRTEIFTKYGCNNSAGCPLSKRPALLEELNNIEK